MGNLYSGFGDNGYTQTCNNRHIQKTDLIIELLGTLDEFTSVLGVAKTYACDKSLFSDIELVQKKLVSVMGEVAGAEQSVTADCISTVEKMCDKYCPESVSEFCLPGTNPLSAQLDVARTVMRRAERIAVKTYQLGRVSNSLLVYFNRLSDLIFAMARYSEKKTVKDFNMNITGVSQGLTLEFAKELSLAIEKRAQELGKNVVIAITDTGSNLVLLHSMDNAYIASSQIAQDKAYTSVALKMPTHIALIESRGGDLDGLSETSSNRISLLGGGYPLVLNGLLIGGLGVSGGTAKEDTDFARFGASYVERRFENDR